MSDYSPDPGAYGLEDCGEREERQEREDPDDIGNEGSGNGGGGNNGGEGGNNGGGTTTCQTDYSTEYIYVPPRSCSSAGDEDGDSSCDWEGGGPDGRPSCNIPGITACSTQSGWIPVFVEETTCNTN